MDVFSRVAVNSGMEFEVVSGSFGPPVAGRGPVVAIGTGGTAVVDCGMVMVDGVVDSGSLVVAIGNGGTAVVCCGMVVVNGLVDSGSLVVSGFWDV